MVDMRKNTLIFPLVAAILKGALGTETPRMFSEVGSFTGNNYTDISLMYARTVIRCASLCSQENSCFGYTFDPTSSQCEIHRGCINITSESDGSGKKSYAESLNNLALGKNASTSGVGFTGSADIRQVTDGSWKDAYVRNEIDEVADLFCTNSDNEGSEKWILVDLEKSLVICAVDFYNRVGSNRFVGEMLVTVNDDPQLISDRDKSLMTPGKWILIVCDRHKKGRYVRIQQLYSRSVNGDSVHTKYRSTDIEERLEKQFHLM